PGRRLRDAPLLGDRLEDLERGQVDVSHIENSHITIIHFYACEIPARLGGMATTTLVARPAPRSTPWVTAVAGLVTLGVAMGIGRFAFTPILPMMQQDAAVSVAVGGWLASANYLGYLLGAISAVALRARATTIVRSSLVAIGLATMGMGMTGSFPAWLLLRALAGVASAWVLVFASAWALGRLGAAERPVLRGAVFGGVGAGIAAAGLLCVVLMERGAGSASAWRALGAIALAGTAAVWPALHEDRDA